MGTDIGSLFNKAVVMNDGPAGSRAVAGGGNLADGVDGTAADACTEAGVSAVSPDGIACTGSGAAMAAEGG